MNRAERRRQGKNSGKKAVYQYTEEQLRDLIAEKVKEVKKSITNETVNTILNNYLTITLMTLYDKFDFDVTRLIEFKKRMDDLSDCITGGYVSTEDLNLCMIEELGINLLGIKGDNSSNGYEKAYKIKSSVFNSGVWFTYVSFMKHLKEKLNVGAKRGAYLTECVFSDIITYTNDNDNFISDLLIYLSKFKGNQKTFDFLLKSEDLKKVMEVVETFVKGDVNERNDTKKK